MAKRTNHRSSGAPKMMPKQPPSKNNADARLHEAVRRLDERLEAQADRADRADALRQEPTCLEDLSGLDFDSGQWKIRVVRKEPKVGPNGKRVDGEQKPITHDMDTQEFTDLYGGLVYELTLLGPPNRGPRFDGAGRPIFRMYSKPFLVTIPGAPPKIEMCIGYRGEDDVADGFRRMRPGNATSADARIHEADLEQRRDEERRSRAEREEAKRELEHKERAHQTEIMRLHDRIAAERDRALMDAVAALLALRKTP